MAENSILFMARTTRFNDFARTLGFGCNALSHRSHTLGRDCAAHGLATESLGKETDRSERLVDFVRNEA